MAGASAIATVSPSGLGDEPLFVFGRERRMHARAYDYWVSLLHGRSMPCVGDLDPDHLSDFADHSVLVDIPSAGGAPIIAFLGRDLRDEAGIVPQRPTIDEVPQDTLLSALMCRFSDIIAYQTPVGFEAEFTGANGRVLHRGILLPFADGQGELVSVYGVISWKQVAAVQPAPDIAAAICTVMTSRPSAPVACAWGDGPSAALTAEILPPQPLDQRLAAARTWAALAATDRTRGDSSIHAALGATHDYLVAARGEDDISVRKAVRLIFGDLGRLDRVRFAAALDHAARLGLASGRVAAWLDNHGGGYVAAAIAERKARRAARRAADASEQAAWADSQAPLGHIALAVDDDFLLLIGRRAPGGVDVIAPVPADDLFTSAALARAG